MNERAPDRQIICNGKRYQQLHTHPKWFKTFIPVDIGHCRQMIQALIETQRIMKEIDEVIEL